MPASLSVPADGAVPELVEPVRGPPAAMAGDLATLALHVVRDRDRIAREMNDMVVHRLFSAGLALESALGLLGDHPGAGKVNDAIGELDLAIRDIRNVVFDHGRRPGAPDGQQPG
jgi:signal transduction histidine kinase